MRRGPKRPHRGVADATGLHRNSKLARTAANNIEVGRYAGDPKNRDHRTKVEGRRGFSECHVRLTKIKNGIGKIAGGAVGIFAACAILGRRLRGSRTG